MELFLRTTEGRESEVKRQSGRDMRNDEIDYKAVLADLKVKRSILDSAIAALEQWQELDGGDTILSIQNKSDAIQLGSPEKKINAHSFFGSTIPDAVRKCLTVIERPLSSREITNALRQGGLLTTAKNLRSLIPSVTAILQRMESADELVSFTDGKWGMPEWLPDLRKETLEIVELAKVRKQAQKTRIRLSKLTVKSSRARFKAEQISQIKGLFEAGKSTAEIAEELGLRSLAVYKALKKSGLFVFNEISDQGKTSP
jgi:hypothetical protein